MDECERPDGENCHREEPLDASISTPILLVTTGDHERDNAPESSQHQGSGSKGLYPGRDHLRVLIERCCQLDEES